MAKLVALVAFKDLKDPIEGNEFYVYQKGEVYPRQGKADPVRVEELKGIENIRKEAVIAEEVPELTKAEEKKAKKEAAK